MLRQCNTNDPHLAVAVFLSQRLFPTSLLRRALVDDLALFQVAHVTKEYGRLLPCYPAVPMRPAATMAHNFPFYLLRVTHSLYHSVRRRKSILILASTLILYSRLYNTELQHNPTHSTTPFFISISCLLSQAEDDLWISQMAFFMCVRKPVDERSPDYYENPVQLGRHAHRKQAENPVCL